MAPSSSKIMMVDLCESSDEEGEQKKTQTPLRTTTPAGRARGRVLTPSTTSRKAVALAMIPSQRNVAKKGGRKGPLLAAAPSHSQAKKRKQQRLGLREPGSMVRDVEIISLSPAKRNRKPPTTVDRVAVGVPPASVSRKKHRKQPPTATTTPTAVGVRATVTLDEDRKLPAQVTVVPALTSSYRKKRPPTTTAFASATVTLDDCRKRPATVGKSKATATIQENDDVVILLDSPPALTTATVARRPPSSSLSTLQRVLSVFPDVELAHVQKLLREQRNDPVFVISLLANRDSYPKEKPKDGATGAMTTADNNVKVKRTTAKYDYTSVSSFDATTMADYRTEARTQLRYDFPYLTLKFIDALLQQYKYHYTLVRKHVMDALLDKQNKKPAATAEDPEIQEYNRVKTMLRKNVERDAKERIGRPNFKKPRREELPILQNAILQEEVRYAQSSLEAWMADVQKRLSRQHARQESVAKGNAIECACCFDQVAMEEMVPCREEGHLFCMDCIHDYAKSQVFSSGTFGTNKKTKRPALELLCCHESGCQSGFVQELLHAALPSKTLEKYNELQTLTNMKQAGMADDISNCPKCGFPADVPVDQMIFTCPVEDCGHVSCKKCGKPPHIPLRCDEVVTQKRKEDGRLRVEEALAKAKIRECPKCKTSFVKDSGCNKMTCRCGLYLCYICRAVLDKKNPYAHFCQTAHCDHKTCKKCTLYSKAEEDDQRAMREAGITAAELYNKELQEENNANGGAASTATAGVKIDVDQMMKVPPKATRKKR